MNKSVIKSAYSKIHASDEFKYRTISMLESRKQKRLSIRIKPFAIVAASLIVVLCFAAIYRFPKKQYKVSKSSSYSNTCRITIVPKIEPPKDNNVKPDRIGDMIGLVVYRGRVYIQAGTSINIEDADKLIDYKLGTAKCNIDEWSKKKDYKNHLFATFSGDIYSVKGYHSDFRIMSIFKYNDGSRWACFYECLNGINLINGYKVFSSLNMKNNISKMQYVQWNDFKTPIYNINDKKLINRFVDALNSSSPYLFEQIPGKPFDSQNSEDYRIIRIVLKDGCNVTLKLRKGGYVTYSSCVGTTFKMYDKVFDELWDKLDYSKDTSIKK